jgi:hypothetical protein
VNIGTEIDQIGLIVDVNGRVASLEERTAALVPVIERLDVAVEDALGQKPGGLIAVLVDKDVIVIGHQAVGDHSQIEFREVALDLSER